MAAIAVRLLRTIWFSGWPVALDFGLPLRCSDCGLIVDGDHCFCVDFSWTPDFPGPSVRVRCAMQLHHDLGA